MQDQRPPQDTLSLLHSHSKAGGLSRSSHRRHTSPLRWPMCRMCLRQLGPRACGPRGSLHQLLEGLLNSQPQVRTKIGNHLPKSQNGCSTARIVCLAGSAPSSLAPAAIPWRGGVASLQGNSAASGPVISSAAGSLRVAGQRPPSPPAAREERYAQSTWANGFQKPRSYGRPAS